MRAEAYTRANDDYERRAMSTPPPPLVSMRLAGPPNTGKKSTLFALLLAYYAADAEELQRRTLVINCITHPPGAHFVRDAVRPFAATRCARFLRAVVFLYADHLTLDAQTALRRCIELHSATARFFLVLHDDALLIAPIRSRVAKYAPRLPPPPTAAANATTTTCFDNRRAAAAAAAEEEEEDAIDALEKHICRRQAGWSGLGHLVVLAAAPESAPPDSAPNSAPESALLLSITPPHREIKKW